MKSRKIVVVGAGSVGATFAFALAQSGLVDEICIVDLNEELAKGQVLDLAHGMPFFPPVRIIAGSKQDYADAQVIVITAGASQHSGSGQTRLDLLGKNIGIIEQIMDDITEQDSPAVVLMVTNPVDVLTQVALRHSGWDRSRIFGSGTVLDSARFRYLVSQRLSVGVHNVHAYILGEHGDSEFAAWSLTNIAGMSIESFLDRQPQLEHWAATAAEIEEEVRHSAYHIVDYKGATNFGIALALVRIITAIVRDQSSILTVSVQLQGEYGLDDVCLSVPCQVDQRGIERILAVDLLPPEREALHRSAKVLKDSLKKVQG